MTDNKLNDTSSQGGDVLFNANYIKVWWANFMIFFSFMLVMPLLPLYLNDQFGAGKHTIGLILCGYTITALIARLFSGYIVDTFPRKTVLLLSYALFSFFFLGYIAGFSLLFFTIVRTLHGAPFGCTTVSNSTVAIDVLPSSRRAEGIGYYGLSNNLATAISPSVGLYIYEVWGNYEIIFILSFLFSLAGVIINSTVKLPQKKNAALIQEDAECEANETKLDARRVAVGVKGETKKPLIKLKRLRKPSLISLDRFFLVKGIGLGIVLACLSFSYGVLSTYIAIYSKEVMGMTGGTGMFFLILSLCLMLSRLTGAPSLKKGLVVKNASVGMLISVFSYLIFAGVHNYWGYFGCAVILGLGNGHMFPAVQTMFVNLAPNNRRGTANSSQLTSWDVGVGLGVVLGGIVSEMINYEAAFWMAWIVNLFGVILFFGYVKNHYERNKLR